jgi:hypothetical protein
MDNRNPTPLPDGLTRVRVSDGNDSVVINASDAFIADLRDAGHTVTPN